MKSTTSPLRKCRHLFRLTVVAGISSAALAAPNDWGEGTQALDDGATRDYYNRAARLEWRNFLGDWHDRDDVAQGTNPFAVTTLVDDNTAEYIEWDLLPLVEKWMDGTYPNQGMLLRGLAPGGPYDFRTKEHADPNQHPELVLRGPGLSTNLPADADTYLQASTFQCFGDADRIRVRPTDPALVRFDLSAIPQGLVITQATMRLFVYAEFGGGTMDVGVFRCSPSHDEPPGPPTCGVGLNYLKDQGIAADPTVVFFEDFEAANWGDSWTAGASDPTIDIVSNDVARLFEPLCGKALRARVPAGGFTALNLRWDFLDETGSEPEEIYFRYYLRFSDDWHPTVQSGKMPGISGTYNTAGWGGRMSDGTNGWSARGYFHLDIPPGGPLGDARQSMGFYVYHADMAGAFGDVHHWQKGYRGYLENNRWYCIDQYCKMNTPGVSNGVLRAWVDGRLAFEMTDLRMRHVNTLKIERIWMNVYHGGPTAAPQASLSLSTSIIFQPLTMSFR
ncbi:MAG: polysaccharide lyase, partial [Verrucomicrobiota bacterium]